MYLISDFIGRKILKYSPKYALKTSEILFEKKKKRFILCVTMELRSTLPGYREKLIRKIGMKRIYAHLSFLLKALEFRIKTK